MVKLRLRRKGRRHYPVYDIVAVDIRKKRDGAYLERLGFFNPNDNPNTIEIDAERAVYWLNVGAQPTEVVKRLLSYEGVLLRRALEFKDKSAEEIQEAIDKHKAVVKMRYDRRKQLRKKRKEDKIKAEEEAKKAEAEAEAAAKEAPPAEA